MTGCTKCYTNFLETALDGSEVEDVITTGVHNAYGIAVDGVNGKIYCAENSLDIIRRADIDGNNVEDLVVNL